MADLLVVTFAGQDDARRALEDLRGLERSGAASVQDYAIVEKDADGKIHHKGEVDRSTKGGAVGGGFLGLLLGLVFFPVLGLVAGAVVGGLIGKSLHHDVDKKLIEDVTNDLTPGTSALFMLVDSMPAALLGLFKPYSGKVYQTSLSDELESQLTEELAKGS